MENADIGSLSLDLKVHCNSPTKCSASEHEPPLPATKIFLPFFFTSKIFLTKRFSSELYDFKLKIKSELCLK